MERLRLRQLGQYDAAFEAEVSPDGSFCVEGGSYVSRGVRTGTLARPERQRLAALAGAVEPDAPHPVPEGAEGFTSELCLGARAVRWWGPPPTEPLRALVRALAALGA